MKSLTSGSDEKRAPCRRSRNKQRVWSVAFCSKRAERAKARKKRIVNLFIDEAAEVVCGPFLQLLNKGRGANFKLFVATQTCADFASRMGSRDKASQLLGNLNNRICLRCVDPDTQKFVASLMPKTYIKRV